MPKMLVMQELVNCLWRWELFIAASSFIVSRIYCLVQRSASHRDVPSVCHPPATSMQQRDCACAQLAASSE